MAAPSKVVYLHLFLTGSRAKRSLTSPLASAPPRASAFPPLLAGPRLASPRLASPCRPGRFPPPFGLLVKACWGFYLRKSPAWPMWLKPLIGEDLLVLKLCFGGCARKRVVPAVYHRGLKPLPGFRGSGAVASAPLCQRYSSSGEPE